MSKMEKPNTFRAYEYVQGPIEGRFAHQPMVDATDKYLAMSGKLLASCKRAAKSMPRGTDTTKYGDEQRAKGYCKAMTGRWPDAVEWAHCNGEKRPRVKACLFRDKSPGRDIRHGCVVRLPAAIVETWEIPHWDWNGHNQTADECRIEETADVFA